MLLRLGLLLGFAAVFLQIAVFVQPLLPKQYQVAPVCETISLALVQSNFYAVQQSQSQHAHHLAHDQHDLSIKIPTPPPTHDHHDLNHQCQYCTVYGNLVLPPELDVKVVIGRIQVRLIAFQKAFHHVYFVLQRLYLLPQGRAPPLFA